MAGTIPPTQGMLYKVAHTGTAYLNVPPNKHRLLNAVGGMVGIFGGRKMMNILAGENLAGEKIDKEDLPVFLQPLHGVLAYDHFSDKPEDRWMKVFDMMVPGITGAIGAGMGSDMFAKEKFLKPVEAKLLSGPKDPAKFTLYDAERQALYHTAKPWGLSSMVSSIFGSASGFGLFPSPLNYSATLGSKFTLEAERAMVAPWMGKSLQAKLLNNHTLEPFRPTKLVGKMIDQLAHNPALTPQNFENTADGIIKTWFRGVGPEQIAKFKTMLLEQRAAFVEQAGRGGGKSIAEIEAAVKKNLGEYLSFGNGAFEKRLIEAGIDPREAAIGDTGMVSTLARWGGDALGFGTTKKLKATQDLMIEGLEQRHKGLAGKAFNRPDLGHASTESKAVAAGFIGTGAAMIGAISTSKDAEVKDLQKDASDNPINQLLANAKGSDGASAAGSFRSRVERCERPKHQVHSKKPHGFVNGAVLDTAEGITGLLNAAIGEHRVHCAVGLFVGSLLGDEVMKALTGVAFDGSKVGKDALWKPLQKLLTAEGKPRMAFNPHSDLGRDKWMQVIRWAVPAVVGTAAVMEGSKLFFEGRNNKLKDAVWLDDVDNKVAMAQSQPWSVTSAVTGLFGYPTGVPMLPLLNYSTNLGTRFSMGSNRKVALPIVGKAWSNNSTLFPFGPPGMIDMMVKEAVNNRSVDPELLETYAIGVLKPWFDNVRPEQVEAFVGKIHEVRDKYLTENGVPDDLKKQLTAELNEHFHHAGLHETLQEIGLDPLQAHLGNNGISGALANRLGAQKEVDRISGDFIRTHQDRLAKRQPHPQGPQPISV